MGHKPIENRPWRTSYRGEIAILAGKALDLGERALEAVQQFLDAGQTDGAKAFIKCLPRGGVIGVVELWGETTCFDSWWFTGPHGLMLRNARQAFSVLPMMGSLSLRRLKEQDVEKIRAIIPRDYRTTNQSNWRPLAVATNNHLRPK